MSKKFDFPYPVLKFTEDTGYLDEYKLSIIEKNLRFINNNYEIDISIENNSNSLLSLLDNKVCSYYVSYFTDNYSETILVNKCDFTLKVPIEILKSRDTIKIEVYLISEIDMELPWNEEMHSKYDIGENFFIRRKDILAISNTLNYSYNISGDTIIKLRGIEDKNHKIIKVNLHSEYIFVSVSKEFNKNYQKIIAKDSKRGYVKEILNSSLVYLVLVNVFLKLLDQDIRDKCRNYRWYNIINNSFSYKDRDLEDILDELDYSEIDEIYKLVEEFMNYNYEKAIISAGERIGG